MKNLYKVLTSGLTLAMVSVLGTLSALGVLSSVFNFSGSSLNNTTFADPLATISNNTKITIYVGDGCPHCAKVEEHIADNEYDEIFDITFKEVYHNKENAAEFNSVAEKLGVDLFKRGVPFMVVGEKYFIGDKPINNYLDEQYELIKLKNSTNGNGYDGAGGGKFNPETTSSSQQLTIPVLIGAALVDAINPCEFAILIMLLTTILAGGVRRRALYAGLAFSLAIFLSYFAMGLGLYSAVASAGFSGIFMKIIGVIAIILGIFNLKDVFFYGKGFVMEVPMGWRAKMKAVIRSVTSPIGAFFVGVLISLFLLPCTSGPYIVVISMLGQKETFWEAVRLLLLYNVIFVLPMLFITFAVYKGFSVERAEEIRQKRLKVLHLIAGVILVIMGVVILMGYA